MQKKRGSLKKNGYAAAFRAAFPQTIPVLTGYLFIGMAFGVMIQEKGYGFLWAMLMSLIIYAGSGQYLAVEFFEPGVSLLKAAFLEIMVNIRHVFYGLSLLERFEKMGKKRLYMIFSLTDETYSLYYAAKVPEGVEEDKFLFAIAALDQSYWILGSGIGALLGDILPFDGTGVDFAMTALFLVIMTEQLMDRKNRPGVAIGVGCALLCRVIFGEEDFVLPAMAAILALLLAIRGRLFADEGSAELADAASLDACGAGAAGAAGAEPAAEKPGGRLAGDGGLAGKGEKKDAD